VLALVKTPAQVVPLAAAQTDAPVPAGPAPAAAAAGSVRAERRGLLQALGASLVVGALALLAPAAVPPWLRDLSFGGALALPLALLAGRARPR
jgi:hypothetical protein